MASFVYVCQQNLPDAIEFLTQSTLRNILAHTTLDETFASREAISEELLSVVRRDSERWGVDITRVEIFNILPPDDIKDAMENQIKSERKRRSTVLKADGERESSIIRSRGQAAQILNQAEGTRAESIADARGMAEARRIEATSQKQAIEELRSALADSSIKASQYFAAMSYLNTLGGFTRSGTPDSETTLILLPREATDTVETMAKWNPSTAGV